MTKNVAHHRQSDNPIWSRADEICEVAAAIERERPGCVFPLDALKEPAAKHWRSGGVPFRQTCGIIRARYERTSEEPPMLGFCTGLRSGLTVIDLDLKERDPACHSKVRDKARERFGETPFIAFTPSGGEHWFYRHNGEGCPGHLREEGLPVDVKGEGGYIAAAPSWRVDGRGYRWGDYSDPAAGWLALFDAVDDLPILKPGSLDRREPADKRKGHSRQRQEAASDSGSSEAVAGATVHAFHADESSRSNTMYSQLHALAADMDERALLEAGYGIARDLTARFPKDHPVSEGEARKTVHSIMRQRREGRYFPKGCEPHIVVPLSALNSGLSPKALMLQMLIEAKHAAHKKPFPLSGPAMERNGYLDGWKAAAYDKYRRELVRRGYLTVHHQGGKNGDGDASLYRLKRRLRDTETSAATDFANADRNFRPSAPRFGRPNAVGRVCEGIGGRGV